MAVFATKQNTNFFLLTDTAVDGTSSAVNNAFVRQAYAWLKSEGFTFIAGVVLNKGSDFIINAYSEAALSNIQATITLRHTPSDAVVTTI